MHVLIVQATGKGGYADPQTTAYISSLSPSVAPDNQFVRQLIHSNRVKLIEELGDKSSWQDYQKVLKATRMQNETEALEAYRLQLSGEAPKSEPEPEKVETPTKSTAKAPVTKKA